MQNYIDDVIQTLKLKKSNYNINSEVYKEILYAIEMLECAKRLSREEEKKVSDILEKLGIRKSRAQ